MLLKLELTSSTLKGLISAVFNFWFKKNKMKDHFPIEYEIKIE